MKHIILVSHGQFASGLKSAIGVVMGMADEITALGLEEGMNMPVLVQLLLQKDDSALEQLKSEVKAISAGTIQIFEEESEDEDEEL